MLINNTPIQWLSKRQKTVEMSTYGSELVAACVAVNLIIEICYELCILSVNMENTALLVGDNMAVVLNAILLS